jgi:HSP20 family molecular chaperone IbpA
MTQIPRGFEHWALDPFDIVWKNFFDSNAQFNTLENKINYPVDIYEVGNDLRFELAVVGLDQEDLDILVEGDTLRITHDRKKTDDTRPYIQRGIARRSFDLAWKVASKFDLSQLTATMDKGLLIIDIPISEEKAPKKITINTPLELKTSKKK